MRGAKQFKASNFSKVRSYQEFKGLTSNEKTTKVHRLKSYKFIARIAAVFIIGFSLYFTVFNNPLTKVNSLVSQKTVFELPDASKVSLNSLSSVAYDKKKWSKNRSLKLHGEAYFEVAKGSKFDVETSEGIVSVLGTKFTVKQRKNYFEVQCFEGVVGVSAKNNNYTLTKGKTFRIINNRSTLDSMQAIQPDWTQNRSTFKSIPLHFVLDELERQYGIEIDVKNVDTDRLFTGGFDHTNVNAALESITSPFNLTYKKEGNATYIIQ